MTRVLVTGASGYVGGRLATSLAQRNKIDLHLAGRNQKRFEFLNRYRFNFHLFDASATTCDLALMTEGVESIVHLMSANSVDSGRDPLGALDTTVGSTVKLLSAASASGVKRFIYLSTVHVYGALVGEINEDTLPRPLHPYGITHRTAEDFVLASTGITQGIVLRLSNAIGAPASPHADCWMLIVNDCCRQAVTKGRITLNSTGEATRDFVGITNVVDVISSLCLESIRVPNLMHVVSGQSCSILEIAKMVQNTD